MSEAKIATQNFDAEFGKAVASVVTVQTKSGSNTFHGSAFDNRESAANLATRSVLSRPGSGPIPAALKNQFGGSIGGPILKDKLFFFGDYQGVRQKVGYSTVQTVPTAQLVSSCLSGNGCNFSQYVAYGQTLVTSANPANPYQIYEPGSTTPYPNAIIPNSQISPEAITLLKLLAALSAQRRRKLWWSVEQLLRRRYGSVQQRPMGRAWGLHAQPEDSHLRSL